MKRFLSLVLAVVMLHSTLSSLAFTVSAGVVESFSYEPAEPIELIQNERLWLEGDSVLYYVYDYEDEALPKLGDTITVNYTDGSSEVLTFSQGDEYYEWMKSSGDTVEIDLFLSDDQGYENQWGLGTHYATVHCFGKEATIQVTIVESPVESVSFVCDSPIEVIENMDGISQTDYFDYDYDMALRKKDKLIKVGYKDGTEKEFAYQGRSLVKFGGAGLTRYSAHFSDVESGEDAYGYIYDLQRIEPWELGTNYITVSYLGVSVQVPVTIRENPVESIEFIPAKSYELIENSGGYFEDWCNPETGEWETVYFYNFYYLDRDNNILRVNYTDGTTTDYTYSYKYDEENDWYKAGWYDEAGNELPYDNVRSYDYQSVNPWTVGGDNYFIVKYMNKEVQVPVTVVAKGEDDGEDTINLVLNQENTVPSECTGIFIPEESGYYRFVSNGYGDPKITINCLSGEYTFDDVNDLDFDSTVYLEAGETVNCYLYNYDDDENCVFTITKVVAPESVLVNFVEPIEIIENTNGYWESYEIWNEELDGYEEFDFYVYDIPFQYYEGNTITLNYADGTSDVYTCEGTGYFNSSGDLLIFEEYADQSYENRWTIGSDNYFTINVLGAETQVPVTIVEDPVESISYTMLKPIEIVENTNGYWYECEYYDEESGEYVYEDIYRYYLPYLPDYIEKFTLNYTDGTTEDFIWNEDKEGYCNANSEYFGYTTQGNQSSNPWTIGDNNSFKIIAYYKEVTIPVTIVESPIKSISYTPLESIKLNEKIDGVWISDYWDEESYKYFQYDTSEYDICKSGDILTVTYSDGTVTEYVCSLPDENDSDGYGVYFTDSEGNALPNSNEIAFSDSQSYSNQWTVGNEYEITLSYMGRTTTIPVVIIENSIESISYTSSKSQLWLEKEDGYYDYYYDSETDEEFEWFRYYCRKRQGDILTINYTDGTRKDFYCDGDNYLSGDGDLIYGSAIKFSDDQSYTNQWELGNSYEFTVSYAGKETQVPIKIVKIESYSFTLSEPIVLYKGYHLSDDGYFIDAFEDGNIFTIHYTDGSKTDYICGFNESKGYSGWFDENGKELDGYLESSAVGSENWEIGEHTATVIYRNSDWEQVCEMEIEVNLVENPVESISVDLAGTIEYIEGINSVSYPDSNGGIYNRYFPNEWDIPYGSTVTVNFKDGTNEVYILKEIWDEEYMQYYPELETEDGKRLKGYDWDVDSDEETNHWSVGENYFTLSVYGVSTQVPVLVKENPVESFYINYGNEIVYEENTNGFIEREYGDEDLESYLVEYFHYKYWLGENGWELVVNYKDGTSETFVCSVLEDYETGSSTEWLNASGDRLYVEWTSDQSYYNQWGIGTHYVTVGCLGKTMQIPIKIVPNENCNHNYMNGFCTICKEEDPSYSIPTLSVGESKTVTISNPDDSYYFYFSPEKSGVYSFSGIQDTFVVFYNSDFNNIEANTRNNFTEFYNYFEAGEKYIIKCGYDSSYVSGSFTVSCDYDFYTAEGTKIIENYMFIPCFKTLVSDFVTASDDITLDCIASCVTTQNSYFGTGSLFRYYTGEDINKNYTIIVEGDLNGDSVCDVIDAAVAQLYSAGFYEPSENETYAANGDLIDEFDVNSYQNVVNCVLSS